ncbi:hypothetical protein L228DRAFT_250310 [Xylona heveae TC161]|uniref:Uncharacterized protein n=1 Tax=Xylona heveae (strain CBS 132557 / TC161) TaxID=1328760 RepID=A0A165A349_XYLHT|nr:hypothetical protein L228DRAFT_250310 [Xylona heveae TC161]KZF19889.1 hypothetical protein L228DRAFT_250310 [Xylona heveae TC161]
MAAQVSLLAYLQQGPPTLSVISQGQTHDNTTSSKYGARDIGETYTWNSFNIGTIMSQYGHHLRNTSIHLETIPNSPPQPINAEAGLRSRFDTYLIRHIRRAMQRSFQEFQASDQLGQRTALDFGEGNLACLKHGYTPDTAYFDPLLVAQTRPNRAPGDFKPSYKWSRDFENSPNPATERQFKQALSQVNFYMRQNNTRYGFLLTNRELVAIQKPDNTGRLLLSPQIPWEAQGNPAQPQMTVILALWYLGMLASDPQGSYLAGGLPA